MSAPLLHATLREPALHEISRIQSTDIVIGLPTQQVNPAIAAQVAKQATFSARCHYPNLRTTLINADVGQSPERRQAIQVSIAPNCPVITSRYTGPIGRGTAISAILHAALKLQAKVILLLDGATENLSPSWIPGLVTLVLNKQADLVKPRYDLPLVDSALNDLLFHPFTRAVWGVNFHSPAAPDCALSANLAHAILQEDVWDTAISRQGFDIWLSTFATIGKWKLGQTALGMKTYSVAKKQVQAIVEFTDIVATLLRQLGTGRRLWPALHRCRSIPTLTQFATPGEHLSPTDPDPTPEIEALALGWMEYRQLWQKILLPRHLKAIERLACQPIDQFYFPSDLWAKIVYDFAVVYNKSELDPDSIIASFYPLYQGRLAGFWPEIAGLTAVGRAGTTSAQSVEFEEHRLYLRHRWNHYKPT